MPRGPGSCSVKLPGTFKGHPHHTEPAPPWRLPTGSSCPFAPGLPLRGWVAAATPPSRWAPCLGRPAGCTAGVAVGRQEAFRGQAQRLPPMGQQEPSPSRAEQRGLERSGPPGLLSCRSPQAKAQTGVGVASWKGLLVEAPAGRGWAGCANPTQVLGATPQQPLPRGGGSTG